MNAFSVRSVTRGMNARYEGRKKIDKVISNKKFKKCRIFFLKKKVVVLNPNCGTKDIKAIFICFLKK